jgi:hypothetical protein
MKYETPMKFPVPKLKKGKRWGSGTLVTFPVSYTYNGGICVGEDWYPGFEVPPPVVPEGYELVGMGIALQLNARPPYATMLLKKKGEHAQGNES